jgi:branched-chain amino acid transport system permease protein
VCAAGHGFASLEGIYWTTSGQVVMMVILGGIGMLWGGAIGAARVVQLQDFLATAGFEEAGIVTGSIVIVLVLLFRRDMWGTARHLLASRRTAAPSGDAAFEAKKRVDTPADRAAAGVVVEHRAERRAQKTAGFAVRAYQEADEPRLADVRTLVPAGGAPPTR